MRDSKVGNEYREYMKARELARMRDDSVRALGDFVTAVCVHGTDPAAVRKVLARLSNTVSATAELFTGADSIVDTSCFDEFRDDLEQLITSLEEGE